MKTTFTCRRVVRAAAPAPTITSSSTTTTTTTTTFVSFRRCLPAAAAAAGCCNGLRVHTHERHTCVRSTTQRGTKGNDGRLLTGLDWDSTVDTYTHHKRTNERTNERTTVCTVPITKLLL